MAVSTVSVSAQATWLRRGFQLPYFNASTFQPRGSRRASSKGYALRHCSIIDFDYSSAKIWGSGDCNFPKQQGLTRGLTSEHFKIWETRLKCPHLEVLIRQVFLRVVAAFIAVGHPLLPYNPAHLSSVSRQLPESPSRSRQSVGQARHNVVRVSCQQPNPAYAYALCEHSMLY